MSIEKESWKEELFNLSKHYLENDRVRLDFDQKELENFIKQKLIEEYQRGFNACLKEHRIKNDFGEKSL